MIDDAMDTFLLVVQAGVPYAITWRIGMYIVNTLIRWVTGGRAEL